MENARKAKHGWALTLFFSILSVVYILPIVIVVYNSFKSKVWINKNPFVLPTEKSFVQLTNYVNGIKKTNFFEAFGVSLFITVLSVILICVCTSMCAWYITRVNSAFSKTFYVRSQ